MSEPRPPADEGPQSESLDDAALTSLLTALPRSPAPAGFRDAVLAAIAADEAIRDELHPDAPERDAADDRPSPRIAPAPSRWRRAAGVIAGLAVTAAALSGVAILWSWSMDDRAVGVAVSDPASEAVPASGWTGEREGAAPFDVAPATARLREAAPAELADAQRAESVESDWDAGGSLPPEAAISLSMAPGALAEELRADDGDFSAVRVVRVQTPSELSNQLAVLQFEKTALRNAIPPRFAELESEFESVIGKNSVARSAAGELEAPAAESAGAAAGASRAERLQSGPIGVLVMAEPDRFEATLREFRTDLARNAATAGATIADSGPLPRAVAGGLLEQAAPIRDGALGFGGMANTTGDRAVKPGAAVDLEPAASTAARPRGNAMGGNAMGGNAMGGFGGGGQSDGVDAFRRGAGGADHAADAPARDRGFAPPKTPYQVRVAPPSAETFNLSQDPAANDSRPQPAAAEPGEADETRLPSRAEREALDDVELRALARTATDDARVPVLLLFEPPPEPTAEPAAEPPR